MISEEKLGILERFGDRDTQDLCLEVRYLRSFIAHALLIIQTVSDKLEEAL